MDLLGTRPIAHLNGHRPWTGTDSYSADKRDAIAAARA